MTVRQLISLIPVFLIQICLSSLLWAQNTALRFEHLTINEGLSQNRVNCILQDRDGFLWIGTNEGLNRYDGYEFHTFEKGTDSNEKLSDDFIQCIYEDRFGNILVGTGSDGLNIYYKSSNQFAHCRTDSAAEIRLPISTIRGILEDKNGYLWIASPTTIERIDRQTGDVRSYIPDHIQYGTSFYTNISAFMMDSSNNLWIGTAGAGLCCFNTESETFSYFGNLPGDNTSISDNDIRALYKDSQGNFWIGTYNGGFNLFDVEKKLFTKFYPDPKSPESLTVRTIMEDGEGSLWLGTRNGVYRFNIRTHEFLHSAHDLYNPYSLGQNSVQVIFKDNKGDFWFGTKNGLDFLKTSNMVFSHYRPDDRDGRGLNQGLVTDIFEDSFEDIWFGTSERGLNRLNRKTGKFTYYLHNPNDPSSIGSNNVNVIIEDKPGKYWIGTFQGGLNYYDSERDRFFRYKLRPDEPLVFQPSIEFVKINKFKKPKIHI